MENKYKISDNIIINDPDDSLFKLGIEDGKEKALRWYQKNGTYEINATGPKRYMEGFMLGVELIQKQMETELEEEQQPKTR